MGYHVSGLGTALPEKVVTQADALGVARRFAGRDEKRVRLLEVLYRRSGVKERRSVISGETAGTQQFLEENMDPEWRGPTTRARMEAFAELVKPLALQACRAALVNGGVRAEEVTSLITVSCTGFFSPGVDAALIEGLGLPRTVGRTNVGFMGCHGAINGLRVAVALANAEPGGKVLLCCAELCTLHFRYGWNPEMAVPNALFGDGAAALVGGGDGGETHGATHGSANCADPWHPADTRHPAEDGTQTEHGRQDASATWTVQACGSFLVPGSAEDMTWRIGDHGFEMTLSSRVPALITGHLRGFLTEWLGQQGLRLEEVGSWVVHPGGPGIVEAVRAGLGLSEEVVADSRAVLAERGNMSSPTVLFIVKRLRARGAARPCVMLAFGPGLVAEVALWV